MPGDEPGFFTHIGGRSSFVDSVRDPECEEKARTLDFIKSSVSSARVGSANDQRLGRKETEHADYRLRLSPERAANRICRHGNRRVRRAASGALCGGGAVLSRAEATRRKRTYRDRSDRAVALV